MSSMAMAVPMSGKLMDTIAKHQAHVRALEVNGKILPLEVREAKCWDADMTRTTPKPEDIMTRWQAGQAYVEHTSLRGALHPQRWVLLCRFAQRAVQLLSGFVVAP